MFSRFFQYLFLIIFFQWSAFSLLAEAIKRNPIEVDVVLVGAGVMSATYATLLKMIDPNLRIMIVERGKAASLESSDSFHNAGTGHSGLCELNYTPLEDGKIKTEKALSVFKSFQLSREFWAYLVQKGFIKDPAEFIHSVPHYSLVTGAKNVEFLKLRYEELKKHPFFEQMEFSDDPHQIHEWLPAVLSNPNEAQPEPMAATRHPDGTDVDFGKLTKLLFQHLKSLDVSVLYHSEVEALTQNSEHRWLVKLKYRKKSTLTYAGRFVFVGAGGGSLRLLQRSGIPEARGLGGFPVGGQFLVTDNLALIQKHEAKVYGLAPVKAPPMSVPHLDLRIIEGKKYLFYGPFAYATSRFLREGSWLDLFRSIRLSNLATMLKAGVLNLDLTRYLLGQLFMNKKDKMNELRNMFPDAKDEDFKILNAGIRVQEIDPDGIPRFGTKTVMNEEGTLAGVLGASPGASTAVDINLGILTQMTELSPLFEKEKLALRLAEILPTYGIAKQNHTVEPILESMKRTSAVLNLNYTCNRAFHDAKE